MTDGHDRSLAPPVSGDSLEEGSEVTVFAPGCAPSTLTELLAQPAASLASLPALPPLSLFPGQTPAQEAKWSAEGNWFMSIPISAITLQAVVRSKPGISANSETASSKGAFCFSISASR